MTKAEKARKAREARWAARSGQPVETLADQLAADLARTRTAEAPAVPEDPVYVAAMNH